MYITCMYLTILCAWMKYEEKCGLGYRYGKVWVGFTIYIYIATTMYNVSLEVTLILLNVHINAEYISNFSNLQDADI